MNERIQELMEQAQDWVDQRAPFASEEHEWFAEKFAELIVRECGILADQYQFEKKNPNPLATERLPLLSSDFIYEHFGVRE